MASNSKSISLGNNYTLQAYFNQTGRNTAGNYSSVYVEAKLSSGNTRWESSYNSYLRVYWHDNRENYDRLVGEIAMTSCAYNSQYYANGTINVTHNSDGNLSGYAYATFTKGGTSSYAPNTGGVTTDWTALDKINRYPVLISGSNFTDETNPTYNITSYNTFPIRIKLEAGGNTQLIIRDVPASTSGNYVLELTEAERNTLRALTPNSNTLAVIETVCAMNGNTELSASFKGYTMSIVNANPVFSNFEFEDINSTTVALTGDETVNINGYSNMQVTIPVASKAEALKNATMSKYRFSIGTISTDITYSNEEDVTGTINNSTSGTYNVYAIDSRNNSTLVTKLSTSEIAYNKITIDKQNTVISRNNNQVGTKAILTLSGTIWNDDFGAVVNSIKTITYRFKKTSDSQWIIGETAITPTVTNNTYTFTGEIASDNQDTSWDLQSSYNIEITISDELSSDSVSLILNSGYPTISMYKEGVGILCAYDASLGGKLQVNGKVIDEDVYAISSEIQTNKIYDGKPVYRRVFEGSVSGVTANSWENLEQCNIKTILDKLIKIEGTITNTKSDGRVIPSVAYENSSFHVMFSYLKQTDYLQTYIDGWNATGFGFSYIVVLEYTKI